MTDTLQVKLGDRGHCKLFVPLVDGSVAERVVAIDSSGNAISTTASTMALDYDGSGNLIYEGLAYPGEGKAAAAWQIRKLTYDGASNLTDVQ